MKKGRKPEPFQVIEKDLWEVPGQIRPAIVFYQEEVPVAEVKPAPETGHLLNGSTFPMVSDGPGLVEMFPAPDLRPPAQVEIFVKGKETFVKIFAFQFDVFQHFPAIETGDRAALKNEPGLIVLTMIGFSLSPIGGVTIFEDDMASCIKDISFLAVNYAINLS